MIQQKQGVNAMLKSLFLFGLALLVVIALVAINSGRLYGLMYQMQTMLSSLLGVVVAIIALILVIRVVVR